MQEKMINARHSKIVFNPRNTYLGVLAQHISYEQDNMKNAHKMARSMSPVSHSINTTQQLHCKSVAELKNLFEKIEVADDEYKTYVNSLKTTSIKANVPNEENKEDADVEVNKQGSV